MKKPLLSLTFLLCYIYSFSQSGLQFNAGATISNLANCNIDAKSKTGFELGLSLFAKYSESFEWTTTINYLNTGFSLPAYKEDPNTHKPINTTADFSTSAVNINYQLSYYVLPDMIAITAGLALGMASTPPYSEYGEYGTKIADKSMTRSIEATTIDRGKVIQAGAIIGASYTYAERYVAYVRYNVYLTDFFDSSESGGDQSIILGTPSLRVWRVGLAYKILPSKKNKRF